MQTRVKLCTDRLIRVDPEERVVLPPGIYAGYSQRINRQKGYHTVFILSLTVAEVTDFGGRSTSARPADYDVTQLVHSGVISVVRE